MKRRNLRLGSLPTNYRENDGGDDGRRGALARGRVAGKLKSFVKSSGSDREISRARSGKKGGELR